MVAPAINSEADIWAEVISADDGNLSPELARMVLKWKFSRRTQSRITRLAQRNQSGKITDVERIELDRFLRVGTLIDLMQAKARLSLAAIED